MSFRPVAKNLLADPEKDANYNRDAARRAVEYLADLAGNPDTNPELLAARKRDIIGSYRKAGLTALADIIEDVSKNPAKKKEALDKIDKLPASALKAELSTNPAGDARADLHQKFNAAVGQIVPGNEPAAIAAAARKGADSAIAASMSDAAEIQARLDAARGPAIAKSQARMDAKLAAASSAADDIKIVQALLTDPKTKQEIESRYSHIQEMTGVDPRGLPLQVQAGIQSGAMKEILKHKTEIAQIYREKGPDAARAEIAELHETRTIQAIDHAKQNPQAAPYSAAKVEAQPAGPTQAEQLEAAQRVLAAMGRTPAATIKP